MANNWDEAKAEVAAMLAPLKADIAECKRLLTALDPVVRNTFNRAEWINQRSEAIDSVIRETYNRANWTNTNVDRLLERLPKVEEQGADQ